MAKCNKFNCKGEFVERVSEYGPYWRCSVCGHKIDKKCFYGGQRVFEVTLISLFSTFRTF